MIQSIKKNLLYHPLFLILIHPLALLLYGTIFAMQFTHFHWMNFSLFYLFLLAVQFIENLLNNATKMKQKLSVIPIALFELLAMLLILYFSMQFNYLVGLLMFAYLFVIHLGYYPYDLSETYYQVILNGIFKSGIINYLAFFIQAQFISKSLYYWSIPLIFLAMLYTYGKQELSHTKTKHAQLILLLLLLVLYLTNLIPLFLLKSSVTYNLAQLVSLPLAIYLFFLLKSNDEKSPTMKSKTLTLFHLSYILLASISVFLKIIFQ